MNKEKKKLLLIDGNAIIHRAYHALPPLTTKKGELVNAVYGFASTLLNVINKFKPDYILATFDLKAPTFRHKEFADYKATRVKAPDELYAQIGRVKELVRAFNIPIYEKEGFEADDIIGTLVRQSEMSEEDIENIIVTGDLDTLQMIGPKTKVYTMRRGISDAVEYDEGKVMERYGLLPKQLTDFKGLRGDPSDNIPGVKGIGEKTAAELLKKYGTLENVYRNIAEIKGATREKLERDKTNAILSKKLGTIETKSPVELDIEKTKTHDFDRKKVIEFFNELNFFSLIKRLPDSNLSPSLPLSRGGSEGGVVDFKFELIIEDKVDEFIKLLSEQKEIAIYLRTTGPASTHGDKSTRGGDKSYSSNLLGIAFSWKTGRAAYLPRIKNYDLRIKNIFEDENIKKIGYDLKYVYEVLKKYDIKLEGANFDIMLAAYVLNPGGKVEFKNVVLEELGEEISGKEKSGQLGLEVESEEAIAQKICRAADHIFKLRQIYEKKIKKISNEQKAFQHPSPRLSKPGTGGQAVLPSTEERGNLEYVFNQIEMPLCKILAEMEMDGIKLNDVIFKGISEKIGSNIENLEKNIHHLAGEQFNINSPKQLAEVLFGELKLPTEEIKKTKTGFSTASSELEKLRGKHKIIEKIEEYRELFKLKTTYLDVLPDLADKKSRLHTTFNQAVTATGRLSSSDPNMQNIPVKSDLGQLLRTAFVAEEGWKLISADYSQIDLRAVAHVSGDKKLIEAFHRGDDIHKITAAQIYKVSISQVTEKMRRSAKALNFGVIYGMSVFGFSQAAGIERDEAKKFIDEYMEKFSGVAKYIRDTKEFAKKNGYVETEIGRRRYIPEINSPNFQVQNAGERMAINMPIQGLAADVMKLAMISIHANLVQIKSELNPNDIKMILQVHDEIILEVKENLSEEVSKKVKEIMENVYKLKVPLVVNAKIGDNWGEI